MDTILHPFQSNVMQRGLWPEIDIHKYVVLILAVIVFIMAATGRAYAVTATDIIAAEGHFYSSLLPLDSHTLYEMGEKYETEEPSKAIACLTIIENRYASNMSEEEKQLCIDALLHKARIYYYCYYDFAEAYEALSKALEIEEENGKIEPKVHLQLGVLYQVISQECKDERAAEMAFENYQKGLANAIGSQDMNTIDVLASNLVDFSFEKKCLDSFTTEWHQYDALMRKNPTPKYLYNNRLYKTFKLAVDEKYKESLASADSLIALFPENDQTIRYSLNSQLVKAYLVMSMKDWGKAIELLQKPLETVESKGIKDIQMEIYRMLAQCYENDGAHARAMDYEVKNLRMKDSLINYSQLSRLEEIRSNRSIHKFQTELEILEGKHRAQRKITWITAVFLLILAVMVVVILNRNRRLQKTNKALYDKNMEWLRQSELEREKRKENQSRLMESEGQQAPPAANVKEDTGENATDVSETETALSECQEGGNKKYKNSSLADDDKNLLMEKILMVMDNTDEYLFPDFSIDRLAELAGSKPKLVSQVINEKYGSNFNNFINEYRIREVCLRIKDEDIYGRMTLDYISKSVGFRARSSFFNAFKSVTGQTPSEFQKIARLERKKTQNV